MTWSPSLCEMWPIRCSKIVIVITSAACSNLQNKKCQQRLTRHSLKQPSCIDHRFCLQQMDRCNNLLSWVRSLADIGVIEPITCGATDGFLPLMKTKQARRAQIQIVANYTFHRDPAGIGCLNAATSRASMNCSRSRHPVSLSIPTAFTTAPHDLATASMPWSIHVTVLPHLVVIPTAAARCICRNRLSGRSYREFYRDIGYDGEYDYVAISAP